MVRNYDYDACCKRVLSQKWVLARLFKTYLDEYENCTLSEIIQLMQDPQLDVVDEFDFIETRNTEDNTGAMEESILMYCCMQDCQIPDRK